MFKNYSKMERKRFKFVGLMLLIPILHFLVFYVYLNTSSIMLAFSNAAGEFTLDNFKTVWREFTNPSGLSLADSLKRSMITWSISVFLVFPLNILFSYALFKKVQGGNVFRLIFLLPGILGGVITTTLYRYMLDSVVSDLFYRLGWISDELYQTGFFYGEASFGAVLGYGIWTGLCGHVIILTGALTRIPDTVLESARLDGVGFFREFFQIALPLIWPTISTLLIFKLGGILMADDGTFLLTGLGNEDASTGGYYIFSQVYNMTQTGNLNAVYYPAALGLVLTVITIPFVLIVRHFIMKHTDEITY